jgi:hypothetical protein
MSALTLDSATSIAAVLAVVFAVGAIASIWLLQTIVQKLLGVVVLGILAFGMWTQRTALQDCAEKVATNFALVDAVATSAGVTPPTADAVATDLPVDDECTFFGLDVSVPEP